MGERNAGAVEKNILKLDPAEIAEKTARGTPLDDGTRHLLESAEEYRELGIRVLLEDTGEAGPAAGENADGVGLFRTASFYRSPGKNEKFIPDSFESFRAVIKENVLVLIRSFQEMPLALQLLEFPSTEKETAVLFSVFCELVKEGHKILAEILLPAPADAAVIQRIKKSAGKTADDLMKKESAKLTVQVGTHIRLPRTALTAGRLAGNADLLSFDYDSLSAAMDGPEYSFDTEGTGELIRIGLEKARKIKSDIGTGLCLKYFFDPAAVLFCHQTDMDYISVPPKFIPAAKLAAAQAAIMDRVT